MRSVLLAAVVAACVLVLGGCATSSAQVSGDATRLPWTKVCEAKSSEDEFSRRFATTGNRIWICVLGDQKPEVYLWDAESNACVRQPQMFPVVYTDTVHWSAVVEAKPGTYMVEVAKAKTWVALVFDTSTPAAYVPGVPRLQ